MQLRFTKGSGKTDLLDIVRSGGAVERIECPKQQIIPHDMVHYAVEKVMQERGFLGRVAAGEAVTFTMEAAAESDGIERLVEVIQGDGWSGGASDPADMIDLYRVTCEARSCPMLPIDAATIEEIRGTIAELTTEWKAVPTGGVMELSFEG